MKPIAIFYGSSTGYTQSVAESIFKVLSGYEVKLFDVAKAKVEDLIPYSNLILGTSTWGVGDLQDDWDSFLPQLKRADLSGKTVALFGLGDCESYGDTFVDGMGHIFEVVQDKDCKIVGHTGKDGYNFSESKALQQGRFVGLPLDETNESNLTTGRLEQWLNHITKEFQ